MLTATTGSDSVHGTKEPEEFWIKKPKPGTFRITTKFPTLPTSAAAGLIVTRKSTDESAGTAERKLAPPLIVAPPVKTALVWLPAVVSVG